MEDYESVLLVKNEVFIYKIPPLTTNKGYKASDWRLDQPDWTGRLKLIAKGTDCNLKLEDKNTGELFAKCPIEEYPGVAIESVTDSSRYFVVRLKDDDGRTAFIGLGFADRSDSFDLNVALQDHFKWVHKTKEEDAVASQNNGLPPLALDLGFKEGQTIKISCNFSKKTGSGGSRPRAERSAAAGAGGILLPPPPGGVKLPPPGGKSLTSASPAAPPPPASSQDNTFPATPAAASAPSGGATAGDNWIQF
ncbi:NECAP-like protein [Tropilaelaps mercedesae]|uniref:NECAP-like protein n=1 Tax=Tropilaelaps mercedesae TaxID=418985 RepID=A0A1V9XWA8_9ACAR|nr:NECAP-like protein [Tropilaelaps mercedesae]